jgi:putative transposase
LSRRHQAGAAVAELCRRYGVSQPTFYKCRHKFGGLEVSDAKRLRLMEEENRKLKKLVADQALDMMVLKDLLAKKF